MNDSIFPQKLMNRRTFLRLTALSTCGMAAGCAVNPVTGKNQLMLLTEADELNLDKENSPHQFSSDYGTIQDDDLNRYLSEIGLMLAARSHRPQMPYSFRCVNATYINAYAFPGGSIAATRAILLKLNNEAELAALWGHEIGHVNARHTARQMTKNIATLALVTGITAYIAYEKEKYAPLAAGLGYIGAGLLLARYSRDNEREADSLGQDYMVKSGYDPSGYAGLMDMLQGLTSEKPGKIEIMFSTHPMSNERYTTAMDRIRTVYPDRSGLALNRDRFMDETTRLRMMQDAIELMQNGEESMLKEDFASAEYSFDQALGLAPYDYAGWVMLAKSRLAQEKYQLALEAARTASDINPKEAQAQHIAGMAQLGRKSFDSAYESFDRYERLLPGNPNTIIFKAISLDSSGRQASAASEYQRYLNSAPQGEFSEHATTRLIEWGYLEPPTPTPVPISD